MSSIIMPIYRRHNLTHVNKQHAFKTENRSKYTNLVLFVLFEFPLIQEVKLTNLCRQNPQRTIVTE